MKEVITDVEVENDVDLSFSLSSKFLPVVYGVQRISAIPFFVDTKENKFLSISPNNSTFISKTYEEIIEIDFDGYAVGGLAVGESQKEMFNVLDNLTELMPCNKPRYLMGVGTPSDILGAVKRGIDMFDCVLPTRSGRTGLAFTWNGRVHIRNAKYKNDKKPLDSSVKISFLR